MYLRQAGLTRNPTFSYHYSVLCRGHHAASKAPLGRKYSRCRQALRTKNFRDKICTFETMYRVKDYINIDKEILSGNPVFKGTRVPIQTLFDHLENGIPLDEFLDDFPTVKKEQAIAVIEIASKILTSKNIEQIYETAA